MSIESLSAIKFNAVWNQENAHLSENVFDKITQFVFSIIHSIARANILPATTFSKEEVNSIHQYFQQKWSPEVDQNNFLKSHFQPAPIEVTTPDGITLRGTHFKNRAVQENAPTVIFFQPNAMLGEQGAFDWVMKLAALQEFPYNFVYFDYRGCALSEGDAYSKKNFYLDGDSIYQFVRDKLGVPQREIHFYGWSFGGAISANVKQIHPNCEGRYVNERSFGSINDVLSNIMSPLFAMVAGLALSLFNWDIQAAEALEKLKGKALIVHHPDDELMKGKAGAYHALFTGAATIPAHLSQLDLSLSQQHPGSFHGAPLDYFRTQNFDPVSKISQFLFDSPQTLNQRMHSIFHNSSQEFRQKVYERVAQDFQGGGLYWGSGEDACLGRNGLTLTDNELTCAIIRAKKVWHSMV